jgi:hypothetical protein
MSQPIQVPEPAPAAPPAAQRSVTPAAAGAALAVAAGTALLGVAAGYLWAALAPRPVLVMTGHAAAAVANPETSAFISADATFCLVCAVGGVVAGLAGYLLAVRRWGPLPMAGVVAGALAAAFVARWVGEQDGVAAYRHLLATLPAGASLHAPLTLRSASAVAFWPLAAGLVAGAFTALSEREPDRLTAF